MSEILSRAWAEIDLGAIAHNAREIRKMTNGRAEVMGVVKADAYGHGVEAVVRTLLDNGITQLAVSMLDEAIQLRRKGIGVPILILGYTDPVRAEEILSYEVTQTVFSHELARSLSDDAVRMNRKARIHIKVDTGMARVGFMSGYSAVKSIVEISRLPGIIIEGIFTHFASADEKDKSYTYMQFEKFMSICNELSRIGVYIPVKHVANSAGLMEFPEMHLDLVRPGIILYGLYPSDQVDRSRLSLKPAMTLKANVILVKSVEKNICVSYGRSFTTSRESRIATIPIGYADGYSRLLTGKGRVLLNGRSAPVIGKICMDQCMIDVTDFEEEVRVGDEAVLFGTQGNDEISADEIAASIGTINYEVVSVIGKRIPRVYIKGGEICEVLNYIIN